MKVLIIGGAGFIGCHLADRFLRDGFQVRILDSLEPRVHPHGLPAHVPTAAEFIRGEVTDASVLLAALQGVDIVSHQAAYQDYMTDFSRFIHVNACSTALLFELILGHRLPVKKVMIASSQAVYGEGQYRCREHGEFQPLPRASGQLQRGQWDVVCPSCQQPAQALPLEERGNNAYNQYAVSKLAQEKTALGLGWLHGIPTVALRYSITQGKRQSLYNHYSGVCRIFCSRALDHLPLMVYEDGRQTRDFVHVDDVVEANMLALEKDAANGHAFNVGSGRPTTILEYAQQVLDRVPGATGCEISGEYRRGDNRHSVSSVEKLRSLGWQPKYTLGAILDDFLEWIQASGGVPARLSDSAADMRAAGVLLSATHSARRSVEPLSPGTTTGATNMTMTMNKTVTMTTFAIPSYLEELSLTIAKLEPPVLEQLVRIFLDAYNRGRTVFLMGNGGSAALASHMACDFGKGTAAAGGRRLRTLALTDNAALITAWANDTCYENIFAQQLETLLQPGDVAFAISGSGNSPNILAALGSARQAGAVTAGLTGFQGGKMKSLCDVCAVVPSENMQIIEDLHLAIAHAVFRAVRHEIQQAGREAAGTGLSRSVAAGKG